MASNVPPACWKSSASAMMERDIVVPWTVMEEGSVSSPLAGLYEPPSLSVRLSPLGSCSTTSLNVMREIRFSNPRMDMLMSS